MSIPKGRWETLLRVSQAKYFPSETPRSAKPHVWLQDVPRRVASGVAQQQRKAGGAGITSCSLGTGRGEAGHAAWWECCRLRQRGWGAAQGLGEQAVKWVSGQLEGGR